MKPLPLLVLLAGGLLASDAAAQVGRPQVDLDDPLARNTPDGFDNFTRGDGDLWVAMWVDERDPINTFDDDIFIAVSQDGGVTYGTEIQVTNLAVSAFDVDNPYLAVDSGVIYITYDDDALGSTTPQAVLTWSDDMGATWTTQILDTDGQDPIVDAAGDNICIVWYNDLSLPHPLKAITSSTGPSGLAAAAAVQINGIGDIDSDGYAVDVDGSTAHVSYFDDSLVSLEDDLYYVSHDFIAGTWSAPMQINDDVLTPLGDVDTFPKIVSDGGTVHFAWNEDDVDPLNAFDDVVFYRNLSGGVLSTELQLSDAPPVDTDFMWMDAEGMNVLVAWTDDGGAGNGPTVSVSNDGGATFTNTDLPLSTTGQDVAQAIYTAIDGDLMIVAYEDDSLNVASIDEVPGFSFSNNSGATWNGPFYLGQNFVADEDIDASEFSWYYTNSCLGGSWQTDGGLANPEAYMGSGIRFPYIDVTHNAATGDATLSMGGIPVSKAGQYARWIASTTLGTQVHPENPALLVELGPSPFYTATTKLNPLPPLLTAVVAADGTASFTQNASVASGLTVYLQGWVNSGCITCGERASDVFEITFP